MTFQPPPPPPPGAGGPPAKFDPKTVNPLDWGILGAGVLAFIFSLLPYYTIDVDYGLGATSSGSTSAWTGFFGWFAALLALAGSVMVALLFFAPQVQMPVPNRLAGLGLYAVATLSVILALIIIPDDGVGDVSGIDTGHGFGFWASLIVIIAGLGLSLVRFQSTGGQLPGGLQGKVPNVGGYDKQGGIGGGQQNPPPPPAGGPPPPPPGYGPPQ